MSKDLAFLASIYAETYTYWKDDVNALKESPETRWIYNVKDVCYTLEICKVLLDILEQQPKKLQEFYNFQQTKVAPALVSMMNIGVKVDLKKKQSLLEELSALLIRVEETINLDLGMEINLKSPIQIKKLFTDFLDIKPVINRKSKSATFGSEAMLVYLENYPLYEPLITSILEYRSIGVFVRTFLSAQVDDDNRMRTSYNLAGTRTYRLASRKNAFGKGMNLQNVPAKGKIDLKYALMDVEDIEDSDGMTLGTDEIISKYESTKLPNCKELFICEEDEMFFDIDLAAADARIIAWVSNCKFLTDLFEEEDGDPYLLLAREYYNDQSITKKDSRRQIFKAVVHGTNYLGQAKTLSAKAGLLVREIEKIQKFYFSLCPEVPALHKSIEEQVYKVGYIENVWGARGWFLDKNDPMIMNKAVAWVGSSPVGILINKGLVAIREQDKDIKILLQVHDSLAGVYKKTDTTAPERIIKYCSIPLPFEVPRVIPVNIKTSPTSYGDCG
jgi:DNA polymerase I-like protein with 3'-5' exonuclease and polymerase domains